jgi:hypothetical protein
MVGVESVTLANINESGCRGGAKASVEFLC